MLSFNNLPLFSGNFCSSGQTLTYSSRSDPVQNFQAQQANEEGQKGVNDIDPDHLEALQQQSQGLTAWQQHTISATALRICLALMEREAIPTRQLLRGEK